MVKTCTKCGAEKPIAEFAVSKRGKDGLHTFCKACKSAASRRWYHATPERQKARAKRRYATDGERLRARARDWYDKNRTHALALKRNWAIRQFGITPDTYEAMVRAQSGKCLVCGVTPKAGKQVRGLQIDHCHETGLIRGLLCRHCNVGLGHFFDSPDLLRAAAAYLERNAKAKTA